MTRTALLAGLVLGLAASSARAGDGVCKYLLRGNTGEHLRVALKVAGGAVKSAEVVWSPARVDTGAATDLLRQQLDIRYINAEAPDHLGDPSEVGLTLIPADGQVAPLAMVASRLTAQGGVWSGTKSAIFGPLARINFAVSVPASLNNGVPVSLNPELLAKIEALSDVSITLTKGASPLTGESRFDLGAHAVRDELAREAWRGALGLAAAAEPCR
jgi:hypothetical protein